MFPEIPRSDIIPALVWIHDQLKLKKKTRGPVEFYIAKDGDKQTDNTFHGSRDFFYKFTFQDIVHYMLFELFECRKIPGSPLGVLLQHKQHRWY